MEEGIFFFFFTSVVKTGHICILQTGKLDKTDIWHLASFFFWRGGDFQRAHIDSIGEYRS